MSAKVKSTGPNGDLDSRRWVILTIRNNGAAEAQFPLPVTVNTQRIAFDRDEPVIAPAYYLDTIDNCILPKYEKITPGTRVTDAGGGQVHSEDDARMVEIKYTAETEEIPKKYQTVEGIVDYVKMVNSEDCPEDLKPYQYKLRLGQMSFNRLNYSWSDEVKEELNPKPKPKTGVKKVATTNT